MPFQTTKQAKRQIELKGIRAQIPAGRQTIQMMILRKAGEDYVFIPRAEFVLLNGWMTGGRVYATNQGQNSQVFVGEGQDPDRSPSISLKLNEQQYEVIAEAIAPFDEMANGLIVTLEVEPTQRYWMRELNNGTGYKASIEISNFKLVDVAMTELARQTYEAEQEGPFNSVVNRMGLGQVAKFFAGAAQAGAKQSAAKAARPSR